MAKHLVNVFIMFDVLILPIINFVLLSKLLKLQEREGNK